MQPNDKTLNILRNGFPLAAELGTTQPEFRAFIMIIPQVPDSYKNPDAWIHWGHRPEPNAGGVIRVKDVSFISGFEIRLIEHHAKYKDDEEWGYDYDYVLDDETTRIERFFVSQENEIESAIENWLNDFSLFEEPEKFNSSLVNNQIENYLNTPDERPHLWDTNHITKINLGNEHDKKQ